MCFMCKYSTSIIQICKVIYVEKSLRREEYSSSLCADNYTSIVQIQVHVVDHVEQNTCSKLFVQQVCVYIHRKVSITVSCNVTYYICLFRHVCSCESACWSTTSSVRETNQCVFVNTVFLPTV